MNGIGSYTGTNKSFIYQWSCLVFSGQSARASSSFTARKDVVPKSLPQVIRFLIIH
jgi:hypothetical protein